MPLTDSFVRNVFAHLESGDSDAFLANVADDVDWTVMGAHPLAGAYKSKRDFVDATYRRLGKILVGPSVMSVTNVLVCGDAAVVEMEGRATARNGDPYNNVFCWLCWFAKGQIVKVRAYLDSVTVQRLIDRNE